MSMVQCAQCERIIDSDDDPDCFIPPNDAVYCERCRDKIEADLNSPQGKVGQAMRGMFAAMDELIALANTEETRPLVCNERIALGQILSRCETLCSFAMAVKPGPLLVRRVS